MVAVTGTNGKTTTSRMIAHVARTSGLVVGWSNTDGIYRDGILVEGGDYSGPSGAARALGLEGVQLAVTETARGGILLKGNGPEMLWGHVWPILLFIMVVLALGLKTFRRTLD